MVDVTVLVIVRGPVAVGDAVADVLVEDVAVCEPVGDDDVVEHKDTFADVEVESVAVCEFVADGEFVALDDTIELTLTVADADVNSDTLAATDVDNDPVHVTDAVAVNVEDTVAVCEFDAVGEFVALDDTLDVTLTVADAVVDVVPVLVIDPEWDPVPVGVAVLVGTEDFVDVCEVDVVGELVVVNETDVSEVEEVVEVTVTVAVKLIEPVGEPVPVDDVDIVCFADAVTVPVGDDVVVCVADNVAVCEADADEVSVGTRDSLEREVTVVLAVTVTDADDCELTETPSDADTFIDALEVENSDSVLLVVEDTDPVPVDEGDGVFEGETVTVREVKTVADVD